MSACKLGQTLGGSRITKSDRAVLRGWLDTGCDPHGRRVSADVLAVALHRAGHQLGTTTLKDHKGRRCVCFR